MSNPLVELLFPENGRTPGLPLRLVWGTVTGQDPLAVRLDGETVSLDIEPDTLISGLELGARVLISHQGSQLVIIGEYRGTAGTGNANSFSDILLSDSGLPRGRLVSIEGDIWILSNARWDGEEFYRIDRTRPAFGFSIQGQGTIPGETEIGFDVSGSTMWVARGGVSYDLIRGGGLASGPRYAAVGGWELGFVLSNERQFTLGGGGMEIDGYGVFPYARIIHNATGTVLHKRVSGVVYNAYTDFAGYDDPEKASWFFGHIEEYDPLGVPNDVVEDTDRFAVVYLPPNTSPTSGVWNELFSVHKDGTIKIGGVTQPKQVGGEFFDEGDGTTKTFLIPHGLGATPSRVQLTPINKASLNCWYTKDGFYIGVQYDVAPGNGETVAVSWAAWL